MNSAFWRYQLILLSLYFIWGEFFTAGGILSQLAFNFALFYPVGFLAGYRRRIESPHMAYLAAFLFNLLSYFIAGLAGVPFESWIMVIIDFLSLFFFLLVGTLMGQHAQPKE